MSRLLLQCVVALASVATVSSPGAAQATGMSGESRPSLGRGVPAGPTLAAASAGVRASTLRPATGFEMTNESMLTATRRGRALAQSQVLMIVGGAAVVTGILVGGPAGTLLVLGGAGIGGYGLYLYLQR